MRETSSGADDLGIAGLGGQAIPMGGWARHVNVAPVYGFGIQYHQIQFVGLQTRLRPKNHDFAPSLSLNLLEVGYRYELPLGALSWHVAGFSGAALWDGVTGKGGTQARRKGKGTDAFAGLGGGLAYGMGSQWWLGVQMRCLRIFGTLDNSLGQGLLSLERRF